MNESKFSLLRREEPSLYDLLTSQGFAYETTGGGCDAFISCLGDPAKEHCEIWITDGDAGTPRNWFDNVTIGFYHVEEYGAITDDIIAQKVVSSLEEAEAFIRECEDMYTGGPAFPCDC